MAKYLVDEGSVAWLRRGEGMVGLGRFATVEVADPAEADAWWRGFAARVVHRSEVTGVAGSGPVAFGSFCFDPGHTVGVSRLVVPQVIIGRRDGRAWMTVLDSEPLVEPVSPPVELVETQSMVELVETSGDPSSLLSSLAARAEPIRAPRDVRVLTDAADEDRWRRRVAEAVHRIESNGLEKVVLARRVVATASEPIDVRHLVSTLASDYPGCWVFSVDGLVGASPEMLVRRERGLATSRVLAGTIRRSGSEETDLKLAGALARSSKNLAEHELAVASVAEALAPLCSGMNVPESPYVLELPNVLHLATDVTAVAHKKASSLRLASALHPSAAVCGTPTAVARAAIAELEGMDRGRYSGPVGWIDANGDGEWAIALRCGMLDADPHRINLFAGCGIVEGSNPDEELAETRAKLLPMLEALSL
ncbi:MAG: isochorismate synthase [Micropruina sp.]|uniref:isochorismate synthase n=1 Tax=Micropruina sp. TaxID=2737536 RepID=UPI0039E571F8